MIPQLIEYMKQNDSPKWKFQHFLLIILLWIGTIGGGLTFLALGFGLIIPEFQVELRNVIFSGVIAAVSLASILYIYS